MNGIQNNILSFKSARTKLFQDAVIEKMVTDFNKKVMDTKCTGDFEKDFQQYLNMQAESNKILYKITKAAQDKTVSYDCAKKTNTKIRYFIILSVMQNNLTYFKSWLYVYNSLICASNPMSFRV